MSWLMHPMKCLTLNRQLSLMVGRKNSHLQTINCRLRWILWANCIFSLTGTDCCESSFISFCFTIELTTNSFASAQFLPKLPQSHFSLFSFAFVLVVTAVFVVYLFCFYCFYFTTNSFTSAQFLPELPQSHFSLLGLLLFFCFFTADFFASALFLS